MAIRVGGTLSFVILHSCDNLVGLGIMKPRIYCRWAMDDPSLLRQKGSRAVVKSGATSSFKARSV